MIEQALRVQKRYPYASNDYTKTFDKEQHDEIITKLEIYGKDLLVIKKYTGDGNMTATMGVDGEIST